MTVSFLALNYWTRVPVFGNASQMMYIFFVLNDLPSLLFAWQIFYSASFITSRNILFKCCLFVSSFVINDSYLNYWSFVFFFKITELITQKMRTFDWFFSSFLRMGKQGKFNVWTIHFVNTLFFCKSWTCTYCRIVIYIYIRRNYRFWWIWEDDENK